MRADLDRLMGELVEQASPGPDPNNPLFADAARAWVRVASDADRLPVAHFPVVARTASRSRPCTMQ